MEPAEAVSLKPYEKVKAAELPDMAAVGRYLDPLKGSAVRSANSSFRELFLSLLNEQLTVKEPTLMVNLLLKTTTEDADAQIPEEPETAIGRVLHWWLKSDFAPKGQRGAKFCTPERFFQVEFQQGNVQRNKVVYANRRLHKRLEQSGSAAKALSKILPKKRKTAPTATAGHSAEQPKPDPPTNPQAGPTVPEPALAEFKELDFLTILDDVAKAVDEGGDDLLDNTAVAGNSGAGKTTFNATYIAELVKKYNMGVLLWLQKARNAFFKAGLHHWETFVDMTPQEILESMQSNGLSDAHLESDLAALRLMEDIVGVKVQELARSSPGDFHDAVMTLGADVGPRAIVYLEDPNMKDVGGLHPEESVMDRDDVGQLIGEGGANGFPMILHVQGNGIFEIDGRSAGETWKIANVIYVFNRTPTLPGGEKQGTLQKVGGEFGNGDSLNGIIRAALGDTRFFQLMGRLCNTSAGEDTVGRNWVMIFVGAQKKIILLRPSACKVNADFHGEKMKDHVAASGRFELLQILSDKGAFGEE